MKAGSSGEYTKVNQFFFAAAVLSILFAPPARAQDHPVDPRATLETVHLYRNLKRLEAKGYLFGHQDDMAYGVTWRYQAGRSDVKEVCGDYPGIFGWDLSGMESDHPKDIDGVPFDSIRHYVEQAYAAGAVITFSWHQPSPLGGGKTAWDTTRGTIASILPGGPNHGKYEVWLDKIAAFLGSLRGPRGEHIPILFRPFHELTGSWFWWGARESTPGEFRAAYQMVVHYLNDVKGLHNLLWVYNTSGDFRSSAEFLERYPGDAFADVVSFDAYQDRRPGFGAALSAGLGILDSVAASRGKIEALAETGYGQIPDATWWTGVLARAIEGHPIAYVLVWRNTGPVPGWDEHPQYFAPYPGQTSAADFVRFYHLPQTFFERDAAGEGLYR